MVAHFISGYYDKDGFRLTESLSRFRLRIVLRNCLFAMDSKTFAVVKCVFSISRVLPHISDYLTIIFSAFALSFRIHGPQYILDHVLNSISARVQALP